MGSRLVFYDVVGKTGGVATMAFERGTLLPFLEETELDHLDAFRLVQAIVTKSCITVENCKCIDGCTLCKFYLYDCHIT